MRLIGLDEVTHRRVTSLVRAGAFAISAAACSISVHAAAASVPTVAIPRDGARAAGSNEVPAARRAHVSLEELYERVHGLALERARKPTAEAEARYQEALAELRTCQRLEADLIEAEVARGAHLRPGELDVLLAQVDGLLGPHADPSATDRSTDRTD